jgi:CRISPR-associated protein Cas2
MLSSKRQPTMHFLIAYDIADPRRLHRVARFMERRAVRWQKSVFLWAGTHEALHALLEDVTPLLDISVDLVQAWPLARSARWNRLCRGTALRIAPAAAVLGHGQPLFVARDEEE